MATFVQGTLIHMATFFRAVLARASYQRTSTCLSCLPPELAELSPPTEAESAELCAGEASPAVAAANMLVTREDFLQI